MGAGGAGGGDRQGGGGVWRESPLDLHPIICTSLSSELPSEAPARGGGGAPLGRGSVEDRPLPNCAGCFVGLILFLPRKVGAG